MYPKTGINMHERNRRALRSRIYLYETGTIDEKHS